MKHLVYNTLQHKKEGNFTLTAFMKAKIKIKQYPYFIPDSLITTYFTHKTDSEDEPP